MTKLFIIDYFDVYLLTLMKALVISDLTGGPGGVYTYLRQIDNHSSSNIHIRVLLDLSTQKLVDEHYQFRDVEFLPLSTRYYDKVIILKNLIIAIKKYRPNIVHIVNGSIKSNLIIREFLAEHSIPFIVTEQFIDDSLKLTSDILERVQTANNRACKTIYVSQGNAGIAKEKFNLLNDNSVVIYNAILPFKKKKSFFRSKPLRVFTTGRCVEQKGIDIIIRAISLLKNHPVEFHFIGDGEKRNEYLTLADMLLKSNQQFIVTDWKNPINYIPFFKHFDLYVSASRQEGFSFGLLEAASSGFPMICSDCSGNDELIRLCKRGELFSADNEIELCSLLSDFWEDPKPLNTKALMNTKTVDQIFDIRQSILQLERIYFELLSL